MEFISFEKFNFLKNIGNNPEAKYLLKYIKHFDPESVIIENEYIDKLYLIDYSNYYSRSHNTYSRFTKRFHFLKNSISSRIFNNWLENPLALERWLKREQLSEISESYIGNIIIKPVGNENQNMIGKVTLIPYESEITGDHGNRYLRKYITTKQHVNLAGISLSINSLPFQAQDKCVGACASAALWVSNYALKEQFDTPNIKALSEITNIAQETLTTGRLYPSNGLSYEQMIYYYKKSGLDAEFFPFYNRGILFNPVIIKMFIDANIPIIACIKLINDYKEFEKDSEKYDLHASVICGYQADPNGINISEIYMHDDQIGNYSKTTSLVDQSFYEISNEWITEYKYDKAFIVGLIIPYYEKIRITANDFWDDMSIRKLLAWGERNNYILSFSLKQINTYKNELLQKNFNGYLPSQSDVKEIRKVDLLKMNFPRFIIVIKYYEEQVGIGEIVLDATNYKKSPLFHIIYN